jgi:hypothetical protein
VGALERGCWSRGVGSAVIPRLYRCDMVVFGPKKHRDVLRSTLAELRLGQPGS